MESKEAKVRILLTREGQVLADRLFSHPIKPHTILILPDGTISIAESEDRTAKHRQAGAEGWPAPWELSITSK